MEQTYRDLVDYVLCNDIENEELCELNDKDYRKIINNIANDLLFDNNFNDYVNKRVEYYLNEELNITNDDDFDMEDYIEDNYEEIKLKEMEAKENE